MNGLEVLSRLKLSYVLRVGRVRSCWLALSVENFSDCLVAVSTEHGSNTSFHLFTNLICCLLTNFCDIKYFPSRIHSSLTFMYFLRHPCFKYMNLRTLVIKDYIYLANLSPESMRGLLIYMDTHFI